MRLLRKFAFACAALTAFAQPLWAQDAIDLVAGEAWRHPHGAMDVPPSLAGLERSRGVAYAAEHLDVGFAYAAPDEEITLYVFRNTNGAVPVWFAQAQDGLVGREQYANPQLVGSVEPIKPAGSAVASGLKATYQPGSGSPFASTGLALFASRGWYVKLRASSARRTPEEMSRWLDQAIAELALPESAGPSEAAWPAEDCPAQLPYRKNTKDAPSDLAASLLGGVLAQMAAKESASMDEDEDQNEEGARLETRWCREARIAPSQVAYRLVDSSDSYLLALGDNGVAVSVAPDAVGMILAEAERRKSEERYAITLFQADRNATFPAQARFPSPSRVLRILDEGRYTAVVSTWGEGTTINLSE